MIVNNEIFEALAGPNKWERIAFPPRGYAPIKKIVLSRGLELDNLRFSMNIIKEIETIPALDSKIKSKKINKIRNKLISKLFKNK